MNQPKKPDQNNVPFIDAVLPGLGGMLAGGVFLVPAMAVDASGTASLIALVIAFTVALLFARSAVIPWRPPNRLARFIVSALGVVSRIAVVAVLGAVLAAHVQTGASESLRQGLAVAVIALGSLLVGVGVKPSPSVVAVVTGIAVVGLGFFAGLSFPLIAPSNFVPITPNDWGSVPYAALLLFLLFAGTDYVASLSGVIVEPHRSIPRAARLGVVTAALLAAVVLVVGIGVGGASFTMHRLFVVSEERAPLMLLAGATGRPLAVWGLGVAALASCSVAVHRLLFEASQAAASMARLRDLPAVLGAVTPKSEAPWAAAVVVGTAAVLCAARAPLTGLVAFGAAAAFLAAAVRCLWKTR